MPSDYQLIGPFGSDIPVALAGEGRRIGAKPDPAEVVLFNFPSASWDAAVAVYNECCQVGIAHKLGRKHGRRQLGAWWVFPGAAGYLTDAAVRLGISTGAIHGASGDATLKNIATRIGEAFGNYQKVQGPTKENRAFTPQELRTVEGMLAECDKGIARLFAMADAAMDMTQTCREAHGMPPGEYRYRVVGPKEEATARLNTELNAARAEIDRLRGELAATTVAKQSLEAQQDEAARLRNDNAELLDQNRQLAAMVESLTAPDASPASAPDPATPPAGPEPAPAAEQAAPSSPKPATPRPQNKAR